MMIIVESGATKSDWRKTDASGKVISRQLLPGMNVSTVSMDCIKEILAEGLSESEASPEDTLYLYTAGIVTDAVREELTDFILSKVRLREIDIQTDLVGAAQRSGGQSRHSSDYGHGLQRLFLRRQVGEPESYGRRFHNR